MILCNYSGYHTFHNSYRIQDVWEQMVHTGTEAERAGGEELEKWIQATKYPSENTEVEHKQSKLEHKQRV